MKSVKAVDVKAGMIIRLWSGDYLITKIEPYVGRLDCIESLATFDKRNGSIYQCSGMSLEKGHYYTIVSLEEIQDKRN